MTNPRLTVVIPTRNRPHSLLRLLTSISSQTLPPSEFEIVVVDDGSEPPLDLSAASMGLPFALRIVRRTSDPGAHESRFAGLREARGNRVLFLDDDITLEPEVLSGHAAVDSAFAIGPILYHPDAKKTAYQRFMARRYADYTSAVIRQRWIPASEIYICNSSGPTDQFRDVFEGIRALVSGIAIPGDGLDEELMDYQLQLKDSESLAVFLPKAGVLHVDTKTLDEARQEKRRRGKIQCRLILQSPAVRPGFGLLAASYGKWSVKLFWMAPQLFRLIENLLSALAGRVPTRLVPAWTCYPPLAIAYWDGINSVAPRYEELEGALRGSFGQEK